MKKLTKLFGFALVAMVLFAGCGKKDKWKGVDQDVTDDLNNLKDMSQATFKLQLQFFTAMSGIQMPEDTKFKTNEDKTIYRYYKETEDVETEITFVKQ